MPLEELREGAEHGGRHPEAHPDRPPWVGTLARGAGRAVGVGRLLSHCAQLQPHCAQAAGGTRRPARWLSLPPEGVATAMT